MTMKTKPRDLRLQSCVILNLRSTCSTVGLRRGGVATTFRRPVTGAERVAVAATLGCPVWEVGPRSGCGQFIRRYGRNAPAPLSGAKGRAARCLPRPAVTGACVTALGRVNPAPTAPRSYFLRGTACQCRCLASKE